MQNRARAGSRPAASQRGRSLHQCPPAGREGGKEEGWFALLVAESEALRGSARLAWLSGGTGRCLWGV